MAILRAGPFGYQIFDESIPNQYFQDEPSSSSNLNIVPINCADFTGSTTWPWRCWYVTSVSPINKSLVTTSKNQTSVSKSFSNPNFGFEGEGLYFSYQADQNFTITGSYSCDSGEGQGAFSSFIITYYDPTDPSAVDGFVELFKDFKEDFDSGTAISGSFSGQLPATVQPKSVRLFFFCDGESSTGSITLNLIAST